MRASIGICSRRPNGCVNARFSFSATKASTPRAVHAFRPPQRRVQVGADVRVADVLVELGPLHELRGLLARAAQDQRPVGGMQRVCQKLGFRIHAPRDGQVKAEIEFQPNAELRSSKSIS